MDIVESLGLIGLFGVCFLASSLYPLGSEVFVLGFLVLDYYWLIVWIIATFGNTLGALTTYGIGRFLNAMDKFKKLLQKAQKYESGIQKYGFIYAFFSFFPLVGDIFVFGLGVFKYPFLKAILFITLGKFVRYGLIIWLYLKFGKVFG